MRIVVLMGLGLVLFALGLEHLPPSARSLLGGLIEREPVHLVAHSILYGLLAAALARKWFPAESIERAQDPSPARRAFFGAALFLGVAGAQELVQAVSRSHLPGREEIFDLGVDIAGATLGLIAWSWFDRRRVYPVARAMGVLLHPGLIGPLGVFALTWSTLRDTRAALGWTALFVVAVIPIAALWWVGMKCGWYSDRDLSVRSERPSALLVGLVSAALLLIVARLAGAPAVVRDMTVAGLVATALLTGATLAGIKVSGHVAVPVGVLVLLLGTSLRGLWPFFLVALSLSWARVREGRHTPREVLAGWGVAGASGLLVRLVG